MFEKSFFHTVVFSSPLRIYFPVNKCKSMQMQKHMYRRLGKANYGTRSEKPTSYRLHLRALPLVCRAADFDGDGVGVALASQGHAVRLQRAEGDLQLRLWEAACLAILCGNLKGVQHRRTDGRTLRGDLEFSVASQ